MLRICIIRTNQPSKTAFSGIHTGKKTGIHDEKHGHPPFQDYFEPRRKQ